MSELEKLYTVEEIAEMTSLTTRTIRNYLKNGILEGRKIGGQWRFTKEDIGKLLSKKEVETDMANESKQEILEFIEGVNTDIKGNVQICTIVDCYEPVESAKKKSDLLCELVKESENETCLRYKYDYDKKEGKARFVIFASPDFIIKAMEIVK